MCGRITQSPKLDTLVAEYGAAKGGELALTPHYVDVEELLHGAA